MIPAGKTKVAASFSLLTSPLFGKPVAVDQIGKAVKPKSL